LGNILLSYHSKLKADVFLGTLNVTQAESVHSLSPPMSQISEAGEIRAMDIHAHRCILVLRPSLVGSICTELTTGRII